MQTAKRGERPRYKYGARCGDGVMGEVEGGHHAPGTIDLEGVRTNGSGEEASPFPLSRERTMPQTHQQRKEQHRIEL